MGIRPLSKRSHVASIKPQKTAIASPSMAPQLARTFNVSLFLIMLPKRPMPQPTLVLLFLLQRRIRPWLGILLRRKPNSPHDCIRLHTAFARIITNNPIFSCFLSQVPMVKVLPALNYFLPVSLAGIKIYCGKLTIVSRLLSRKKETILR